jgi:RES domain-containing protein
MFVYRITQLAERALDLSGTGAFLYGGRWNSAGTYMLYTSMNSSLAYLETLVHFNEFNMPPGLFITKLEFDENLIHHLADRDYPEFWQQPDNIETQALGDSWMTAGKYLGFEVKSAINPSEFNFLLNPLFPRFHDLVKIISVTPLEIDTRLLR